MSDKDVSVPFTLLSDQPFDKPNDPLGFDQLAATLRDLISGSRGATPFTVGIEAGWGMGKSTLMGRLRSKLDDSERVTTVWFNAWTAEEPGLLEGLIKTILNELDPHVLRRALRNEKLVSWVRLALSVLAGWFGAGNAVNQFWETVSVDPRARNELSKLVSESLAAWRKQTEIGADHLLVVFVDDLDRCTPETVGRVFEAIKLYLDAEGLVFVIGFDPDVVTASLDASRSDQRSFVARAYLEKIVQVSYRIPRPSLEEATALLEECIEASGTGQALDAAERAMVLERNQRNPRRVKRFLNGFLLAFGIAENWQQFHPATLIRLHLIFTYFPEFTRHLDDADEVDALEQFLAYVDARDVLRDGSDPESDHWTSVEEAFAMYQLPMRDRSSEELLLLLQQRVPVLYEELASSGEFRSLARGLVAEAEWPRLRRELAEGGHKLMNAVTESEATTGSKVALDRVRSLWVDAAPEQGRSAIAAIRAAGGAVHVVGMGADFASELRQGDYNALIWAASDSEQMELGIRIVRELQAAAIGPRQILFDAPRATPELAARLGSVGARPVIDAAALMQALAGGVPTDDPAAGLSQLVGQGDLDAAIDLAREYALRDEIDNALATYERAEGLGHPEASLRQGELLVRAGRQREAVAALRRAAHSADVAIQNEAKLALARLLNERGDTDDANELYREVLEGGHAESAARARIAMAEDAIAAGETEAVVQAVRTLVVDASESTLEAAQPLAGALWARGALRPARQVQGLLLEALRTRLRSDDRRVLQARADYAETMRRSGMLEGAREQQTDILAKQETLLAPEADRVAVLGQLVATLQDLGDAQASKLEREFILRRLALLHAEGAAGDVSALESNAEDLSWSERYAGSDLGDLRVHLMTALQAVKPLHDPETVAAARAVVQLLAERDRDRDEAIALQTRTLEALREAYGDRDPQTLLERRYRAELLRRQGKHPAAESMLSDVLDAMRELLGADHPDTLVTRRMMVEHFERRISFRDGDREPKNPLSMVLERQREVFGAQHPETLITMSLLGEMDKRPELLQEAAEGVAKVFGRKHPSYRATLARLSDALDAGERETVLRQRIELQRPLLEADHGAAAATMADLERELIEDLQSKASKLLTGEDYGAAVLVYERLAGLLGGPTSPEFAVTLNALGVAHASLGDHGKALAVFQALCDGLFGGAVPANATYWQNLIAVAERAEQLSFAAARAATLATTLRERLGDEDKKTLEAVANAERLAALAAGAPPVDESQDVVE